MIFQLLSQRSNRRILIIGSVIFIGAIFLEVWAVNRLATYGEELSKIDSAINKFNLENKILENDIAIKSSLNKIEKLSGNLGFEKPAKIEYFK